MSMAFSKLSPTVQSLVERELAKQDTASASTARTPKAPQPVGATTRSAVATGGSKVATTRMPGIPTLPVNASGTKIPKPELEPIPPSPPQSPFVTQSPYMDSLYGEYSRKGQLSTLLGRDMTLPTQANRNARLSGYLM